MQHVHEQDTVEADGAEREPARIRDRDGQPGTTGAQPGKHGAREVDPDDAYPRLGEWQRDAPRADAHLQEERFGRDGACGARDPGSDRGMGVLRHRSRVSS